MAAVDLNSDLGESYGVWVLGDDAAMLDVVTSANVACGFHAGDPTTLRRTCAMAAERGVRIGAQVSYPDLMGFGRRAMAIDPSELHDVVLYQLGALDAFAQIAGSEVSYVKPHGALYHTAVSDRAVADAVVDAVVAYDPSMAVLGPPASALLASAGERGLEAVAEGFVDRAYHDDGSLVSRSLPGALLTDVPTVAARAVRMVVDHSVETISGGTFTMAPRSLCVHGDTPGAVGLARAVRHALTAAGVDVHPFT
ncbi:MAG: LamB/YcsF family protein [Ilumatobacteraceae bacterium]|jgi:UPF0271 protein